MVSKKIGAQGNKNDSIWKHDVDEWNHFTKLNLHNSMFFKAKINWHNY